jgi:hypothetical protein
MLLKFIESADVSIYYRISASMTARAPKSEIIPASAGIFLRQATLKAVAAE